MIPVFSCYGIRQLGHTSRHEQYDLCILLAVSPGALYISLKLDYLTIINACNVLELILTVIKSVDISKRKKSPTELDKMFFQSMFTYLLPDDGNYLNP